MSHIRSRAATKEYRDNFDETFGKKTECQHDKGVIFKDSSLVWHCVTCEQTLTDAEVKELWTKQEK